MWLFLAFVVVPLIEITLFIQVGSLIGVLPTLLLCVLSAVIGSVLVRRQGAQALEQLRRSFNDMRDPAEPIAHGAMIILAGAMLITPGFFTDILGILLLIPAVRRALMRRMAAHVQVHEFSVHGAQRPRREPHRPDVIDGEFYELDGDQPPPRRPPAGTDDRTGERPRGSSGPGSSGPGSSGWTRH